jgi:hypothetical protein
MGGMPQPQSPEGLTRHEDVERSVLELLVVERGRGPVGSSDCFALDHVDAKDVAGDAREANDSGTSIMMGSITQIPTQ